MKKLLIVVCLLISVFNLTGCGNEMATGKVSNQFMTIIANIENKIVIDTTNITSEATFVNYEVDGIIIQLIVVRGTDGKVRIAFNTCQACNPSPNAYFIQNGEYLECQNCENKFHIDKIGIEIGGCNPAPVLEKEETDNLIVIDKDYLDTYKEKFENWNGPIK